MLTPTGILILFQFLNRDTNENRLLRSVQQHRSGSYPKFIFHSPAHLPKCSQSTGGRYRDVVRRGVVSVSEVTISQFHYS